MDTLHSITNIKHINKNSFFLIAGPCVVESDENVFMIAEKLKSITDQFEIPFIFKASYKKGNRSRGDSFTGIGDDKALDILKKVRDLYEIPVLTDIHSAFEVNYAAQFVDVIQIPAFLCRQTDVLVAAAKTHKVVNIKKGQFVSPQIMEFAAQKVREAGNKNIWLTERGSTFGYYDLVVDFRSIPILQSFGYPVILDITHSLQQPNTATGVTGGLPHLIETIAKAGIAVGTDGIFIETHPNPSKAKSDGANMLQLDKMEGLLEKLVKIRKAIN